MDCATNCTSYSLLDGIFVQTPWAPWTQILELKLSLRHQFFLLCLWHVFILKLPAYFRWAMLFINMHFSSIHLNLFFLIRLAGILISIFLVRQRSLLWLSWNLCCLRMQINYHGGDYLTLSDSYCSGMLFEQLVWSSGYVMLLQFTGSVEAPEGFIPDMVSNAKYALYISLPCL